MKAEDKEASESVLRELQKRIPNQYVPIVTKADMNLYFDRSKQKKLAQELGVSWQDMVCGPWLPLPLHSLPVPLIPFSFFHHASAFRCLLLE